MKKGMKKRIKLTKEEKQNQFSLIILFSIIVFVILLLSVVITVSIGFIASELGWFHLSLDSIFEMRTIVIVMLSISLLLGFGIAFLALRYPLKPVSNIILQMNRLARGDFKARVRIAKPFSSVAAFHEVEESFNKMAEELESTEMLRSDFINNFSHEFKTPIVSISGFAKLLKRGNLTEEQKTEYINIIEEESVRLATMANNVLNLTKVENQTILTDLSRFNLSEQIRSSVLLLEDKWIRKETELFLEMEEVQIQANEELLKQVWINLIDNAIKFSPNRGFVRIGIIEKDGRVFVCISNSGKAISEENQKKIFHKFYQADESHSGEGNGIGLAIVKRIVELHGGEITVQSENETVSFTVSLPQNQ